MFNDFITEQFKGHKNLKILFRNENQTVWDQFLEQIEDAHFYYFSQELNYQKLYQAELGYEDQDLSFVIFYDNKVVSVFGLSVFKKKNIYFLGCHGKPVLSPIFQKQCPLELEQLISNICFNICKKISEKLDIKKWYSNVFLICQNINSEWIKICKKNNFIIYKTREAFFKIANKKIIEKKYKRQIKENFWVIKKFFSLNKKEWNLYKYLHLKVAGKKTRSDKTWDNQLEDINKERGFVIFLYDKEGNLAGGNFYRIEKNISIYAVGVNDRSFFPKKMSHYSLYHGLIEMLNRNIKWLSLGDVPLKSDFNNPTSKEVSIGDFKRRFASNIFEKLTIEIKN